MTPVPWLLVVQISISWKKKDCIEEKVFVVRFPLIGLIPRDHFSGPRFLLLLLHSSYLVICKSLFLLPLLLLASIHIWHVSKSPPTHPRPGEVASALWASGRLQEVGGSGEQAGFRNQRGLSSFIPQTLLVPMYAKHCARQGNKDERYRSLPTKQQELTQE